MDFVTWSLLLGALVLFLFYLANFYNYWKKRGVPTADGLLPLVGHTLPVLTFKRNFSDLCKDTYDMFKEYSMVGMYDMKRPALLVREPDLAKTVLQANFSSFHENSLKVDPELDPLLDRNPFFTSGEVWMTGRKRLTYAFSSMRLKILFKTVSGVCEKFRKFVDKNLEQSGKYEVELKELFSRFTGEVVANAGWGVEGFCFEEPPPPISFLKIGQHIFEPKLKTAITQAMVFFMPWLCKILQVRFIPKSVHDFFMETVNGVIRSRKNEATPRNDFFQLMTDFQKQEGEEFSQLSLAAHALSFFVDGYETSSITLSFAAFLLAQHADVQQNLRDEITSVIEKHGGQLTYEGLKEMTYMDQVLNESQRMYPALGLLQKVCTETFELRGSDGLSCRVDPGTEILIPIHGLHMDPNYWTDPETFDPHRFGDERKKEIKKFTFLPFGEGPRICVGMRMAILQMKACLATLLENYALTVSPKTRLPLKISPRYFLASPVGGLWVNIQPV